MPRDQELQTLWTTSNKGAQSVSQNIKLPISDTCVIISLIEAPAQTT